MNYRVNTSGLSIIYNMAALEGQSIQKDETLDDETPKPFIVFQNK